MIKLYKFPSGLWVETSKISILTVVSMDEYDNYKENPFFIGFKTEEGHGYYNIGSKSYYKTKDLAQEELDSIVKDLMEKIK